MPHDYRINEIGADSDGSTTPSTPQTKLSIVDRLSNVIEKKRKERRKEKETITKEKDVAKEKKKEAREKVEKVHLYLHLKPLLSTYSCFKCLLKQFPFSNSLSLVNICV